MESLPVQFCRNIRLYWRKRRYQRLEGTATGKKSVRIVKLGGGGGGRNNNKGGVRRRRSWKIRRAFRPRVRFWSPMKLLTRVRDAYVDAMLGLAGKDSAAGPNAYWAKRIPKARPVRAAPQMDFETRMLVEIYKSFLNPWELEA